MPSPTSPAFECRFEFTPDNDAVVIALAGKMDPEAVQELYPQIQEVYRAGLRRFAFSLFPRDAVVGPVLVGPVALLQQLVAGEREQAEEDRGVEGALLGPRRYVLQQVGLRVERAGERVHRDQHRDDERHLQRDAL